MKTHAFLLAAALLAPAAGAFAQAPACVVAPLAPASPAPAPGATATQPTTAGSVTYFGVESTHDAHHEQFARLRQVMAASQPTVVFFEKPDLGVDSTEAATIERLGESGYVRLLAQQHGVPTERLDDPLAEYRYLRAHVAPTELKLYYLLRINQQRRQSTGASKTLALNAMRELIKNSPAFLPGTGQVMQSPAEFEVAYRRLCPAGGPWWQRTVADLGPQTPASRPTEAFVQAINDHRCTFRTQRLNQKIAEKIRAGERVLVVLDRRYLPAPATYAARAQASH